LAWRDFWHNGTCYGLTHLNDVECVIDLDGTPVTVRYTFGPHTFTDEKENGPHFYPVRHERRYICRRRHALSFEVVPFMQQQFLEGHVRQHFSRNGEQWFTTELDGAAVFTAIQKSVDADSEIKVRVISSYPLDRGLQTVPTHGALYKVRTLFKRKLVGR